jgi:hypothetical protein
MNDSYKVYASQEYVSEQIEELVPDKSAIVDMVKDLNLISPVTNKKGAIFTNKNGDIFAI